MAHAQQMYLSSDTPAEIIVPSKKASLFIVTVKIYLFRLALNAERRLLRFYVREWYTQVITAALRYRDGNTYKAAREMEERSAANA